MWMRHQAVPDPVEVTDDAYRLVWAGRGWEQCDPPPRPDPALTTEPEPAIDPEPEPAPVPVRRRKE